MERGGAGEGGFGRPKDVYKKEANLEGGRL